MEAPALIRVKRDDYQATTVGHTADGYQFFLTTPFVPLGHEFVALYLFNAQGQLREAHIDDLGARDASDTGARRALIAKRLAELGNIQFGDIEVAPFRIERFGLAFGLIAWAPEEAGHPWHVTAEPGDYMAFYPPFDGDYDI